MPQQPLFCAAAVCLVAMTSIAAPRIPETEAPPEPFAGLELRSIGPAFKSGRIADIAIDPSDPSTWYVAVGSGGVWKTTNAGTTWTAIFDDQSAYSIGCLTLDPNNRNTVWVGTGENIGGRHVGFGDGVYRSRDGGESWENLGLKDSQHISRIIVDPRDSDRVLVAAQGPLWSSGGDRGLFKTTDGGTTWTKVLGGWRVDRCHRSCHRPAGPRHLVCGDMAEATDRRSPDGWRPGVRSSQEHRRR